MATNSHSKIRTLMKNISISNMEFFTSTIFKKHFEDIATNITKRWSKGKKISVQIMWDGKKTSPVAYTDNSVVVVNAGHPMIHTDDRITLYKKVLGLFAHELGHNLWTDFLASMSYEKSLNGYRWYPKAPNLNTVKLKQNEIDFWDFANAAPQNLHLLINFIFQISNIIEDGFIEEQIFKTYPGTLSIGLKAVRNAHWDEIKELSTMISEEDDFKNHILFTIFQELLEYAKYGEVKCSGVPLDDEHIIVLGDLIPVVDVAMQSGPKERLRCCSEIALTIFPYLKDYIVKCLQEQEQQNQGQQGQGQQGQGQQGQGDEEEQQNENGSQGTNNSSPSLNQNQSTELINQLSEALSNLTGNTAKAKGNTVACATVNNSNQKSEQSANRQKTKGKIPTAESTPTSDEENNGAVASQSASDEELEDGTASGSKNGDDENGEDVQEGSSGADAGEDEADNDADDTDEEQPGFDPSSDGGCENGTLKTGNKNGGKINNGEGICEDGENDGEVSFNDNYEEQINEDLEKSLEKLFDSAVEKKAFSQIEKENLRELNSFASNIDYGNAHRGIKVRVNRINTVSDYLKDEYNSIAPPLLQISRRLVKKYEQIADDARTGGRLDGLLMGRKFNAAAAYRNDGKVFVKNILPQDMQPLSVALLLDESGSMGGLRETAARATAIILQNFCETLGVPIAIYGHTTSGDDVELFSYCEFDSISKDDKYRLIDIGARNCNRDGAALRFVAEKLVKRPEEAKLLMLVSDGQPNGYNYSGSCAEDDLRGIQKEYTKKGVCFCAAAIGDDRDTIERIYGDAFLNVSDLEELPQKLVKILSRYLHTI